MRHRTTLALLCFLFPVHLTAQEILHSPGSFGCGELLIPPDLRLDLKFTEVSAKDAVQRWQTRPAKAYTGFDAKKYDFTKVVFYRWHTRVREGNGGLIKDSTEGLVLGVQTISTTRTHWYEVEVAGTKNPESDLLYIQLKKDIYPAAETDDKTEETSGANSGPATKAETDEMDKWLDLDLATPDPAMPIFSLSYSYNESGANAFGAIENNLLVDLRGGAPRFLAVAACNLVWEGGGVCTGPDTNAWIQDSTSCDWEASASDFHCTASAAYGGEFNPRRAERGFYLSTRKAAKPKWLARDRLAAKC